MHVLEPEKAVAGRLFQAEGVCATRILVEHLNTPTPAFVLWRWLKGSSQWRRAKIFLPCHVAPLLQIISDVEEVDFSSEEFAGRSEFPVHPATLPGRKPPVVVFEQGAVLLKVWHDDIERFPIRFAIFKRLAAKELEPEQPTHVMWFEPADIPHVRSVLLELRQWLEAHQ